MVRNLLPSRVTPVARYLSSGRESHVTVPSLFLVSGFIGFDIVGLFIEQFSVVLFNQVVKFIHDVGDNRLLGRTVNLFCDFFLGLLSTNLIDKFDGEPLDLRLKLKRGFLPHFKFHAVDHVVSAVEVGCVDALVNKDQAVVACVCIFVESHRGTWRAIQKFCSGPNKLR
jgi:hypothetical protein